MQQSLPAIFSPYQKIVLLILALLQFIIILDFMIIAPIGDVLMKSLDISTEQFGLVVSSYAFSAAISALVIASMIVYQSPSDHHQENFDILGYVAAGVILLYICLVHIVDLNLKQHISE